MELLDIMQKRRSVRDYTGGQIPKEDLEKILQAGLLSVSSRAIRPWELIVVKDRSTLDVMSGCREKGAGALSKAGAAVVVVANEDLSDVWIEDCSVVMTNMHLMADSLGLGSVWIQGRNRKAADGEMTEEYLRKILNFPANYRLCAMLAIGVAVNHPPQNELSNLNYEKIHSEKF